MILLIPNLIYSQISRGGGGSRVGWTAVLDIDDFTRGAAKIDQTFDDMIGASARFDKIVSGVSVVIGAGIVGAAGRMAGAITEAIGNSIEMAKIFEQQMAKVRTLIQVTDAEFDRLGKGVLAISERLPQSLGNLTSALFDLISAGVKTHEVLDVLALASEAAVAGFTSVDVTARLGISTINAYGLEITDLNRVYDIFFETARIGVTTFESMASELGSVLPSAFALGVSLEELGGIFAAATKGGLSTAETITALDATFSDLVEKKGKLEELASVKLFDAGEFRGLVPIFNDLSEALGKLTAEGRTELLNEIGFGRESGRIIKTITNDMDTFNKSIEDVTNNANGMGKALEIAIVTADNQLSILGNRIKVLGLNILQPFVGMLGSAATGINRLVDSTDLSQVTAQFQSLATSIQNQVQQVDRLSEKYGDLRDELSDLNPESEDARKIHAELNTIIGSLVQIVPSLAVGWDKEKASLDKLNPAIEQYRKTQDAILKGEFLSGLEKFRKQYEKITKTIETLSPRARLEVEALGEQFKGDFAGGPSLFSLSALGFDRSTEAIEAFSEAMEEGGDKTTIVGRALTILENDMAEAEGELGTLASALNVFIAAGGDIETLNIDIAKFGDLVKLAVEASKPKDLTTPIKIAAAIDPLQFDKVKAKLKTERDKLELAMLEAGKGQEEIEVELARRSIQRFTEALAQKVDKEKDFNDALLEAKIELAKAEIDLLERTQSERERIEDETTRNQEEAARTRVKLFADEINAEIKLLDGLKGQDKTVAIRVLSEVGGFGPEKIERVLSGIEGGVLDVVDVLEIKANVIREAMNALDQNLDQQTKDTSAFTAFAITQQGRIADAGRQAQSERIKGAQETADKEFKLFLDMKTREGQIKADIQQKAQEGREAEEQGKAEQVGKGLIQLRELAKTEEEDAFQRAAFLVDTDQISLEGYRGFLSARLDFLEESGRAETSEWRNVALQLHNVGQNIADDAEDAAQDMERAFVEAAQRTANQVSDAFRLAFGEQLPRVVEAAIKNMSRQFKTFEDFMLVFSTKLGFVKEAFQLAFDEDPIGALQLGLTIGTKLLEIFAGKTREATGELDEMRKRVEEAADAIRNELSSAISDSFTEGVENIDFDALINAVVRSKLAASVADVVIAETGLDKGLADLDAAKAALGGKEFFRIEGGPKALENRLFDEEEANRQLVNFANLGFRGLRRVRVDFQEILDRGLVVIGEALDVLPQTLEKVKARLPESAQEFLNIINDAESRITDLTPSTSFRAVTEPQGNAILSTLAQQTRHLSSIQQSGLQMVAILNRQPTNGNVIPVAQLPAAPPPVQRFEFADTINIQIDGEVVMEANGIEDVDVDFIAERLRERIVRRREAIIGRAR